MEKEILHPERGTKLRQNKDKQLTITVDDEILPHIYIINEGRFLTKKILPYDLIVEPNHHYMLINKYDEPISICYSEDIENHPIIYDPYKYEDAEHEKLSAEMFLGNYAIPDDYIDTLPKWYSFKFTFPEYNLIFIRPELGISFQIHQERSEHWEILQGNPIILNGHTVYYEVADGSIFEISPQEFHTVINPHANKFVLLKEQWGGNFDEEDIMRVFNPNHYS
ncbi:MAG: hypothetical protein ACOC44_18455 [Promethearchaeia archaeon]